MIKGIYDAASPPEGVPAEAGDLLASSLPWSIDCPARMSDSPLKSLSKNQLLIELPRGRGKVSLRVNWVSIYEGGRFHYPVDGSPYEIVTKIHSIEIKTKTGSNKN